MIYTDNTKKALKIMFEKHKDQVDKSGIPYAYHPLHVAEEMTDEDSTIVALLHDVVEDTDTTFEEVESYGFSQNVIDALKLLTHTNDVEYEDYIRNISTNDLARKVKLADLRHNMDTSRLNEITSKDIARYEKYKKSYEYLENIPSKNSNN